MLAILIAVYATGFILCACMAFILACFSLASSRSEFAVIVFLGALLWPVWVLVMLFCCVVALWEGVWGSR